MTGGPCVNCDVLLEQVGKAQWVPLLGGAERTMWRCPFCHQETTTFIRLDSTESRIPSHDTAEG